MADAFETLRPPDEATRRSVLQLAARTATPLPDQLRADLIDPRPGVVAVCRRDSATGSAVAYAQASPVSAAAWQIAAVPARERVALGALLGTLRATTGGHSARAVWWTSDHDAPEVATRLGLRPDRELLHMAVGLPLRSVGEHTIATRPFRTGIDEPAWLDLNRAAFAWHPEQGGWDLATLRQRQAEPWWDPAGFLVHERDGRMIGFCWTKIHADHDPPLGEIYVIGVDPAAHGRGLGAALTRAGLDSLARRGLRHGMLYVDAANTAAVAVYRRLGFVVTDTQRAFVADLPAASTGDESPTTEEPR